MDRLDLAKSSKFTRGEKCIFIHLILTFVLIILSVIIYFVHLCLVNHPGNSYLNTRRSLQYHEDVKEIMTPDYLPVGVLYLNITPIRVVCNTIQLREKWSIAPAHCVIIRTDPSLAQLLPKWEIMYRTADLKFIVTKIMASIAHPHFNREDFSNNIGLFEHTVYVPIRQYITFNRSVELNGEMVFGDKKLRLGSWNQVVTDDKGNVGQPYSLYFVNSMDRAKCVNFMAVAVDLRSYEHCVTLQDTSEFNLYHGAALFKAFDVFGIFSWGERHDKMFPFVMLRILDFKDWLEEVIILNNIV